MMEWLITWEPEHIVGFTTAISAAVAAWWLHGKSKTDKNRPPSDLVVMSSVRLHPLDLLMLESAINELHEVRREVSGTTATLQAITKDVAILLDRARSMK